MSKKNINIDAFFYLFGLAQHPLKRIAAQYKYTSDLCAIQNDWQHVGNDIKKTINEQAGKVQPAQ